MEINGASDQEVERQLNPIACSHCRQRKRKCDRRLPYCLQCNDPANCHYPEQNRRGLPIGFINRLEARLAETEEALFRLVQSIDEPDNKQASLKQSSQKKDDRIREWDNLPLKSMGDVRAWYRNRLELSDSPATHVSSMELDQNRPPLPTVSPDARRIQSPDDTQNSPSIGVVLSGNDDNLFLGDDNQTPASAQSSGSKAKEMEQRHPNMYF